MSAVKYIGKRLLETIPILFVITFLSFGMMRLAGSDVIEQKAMNTGEVLSEEEADRAREELGLDQPFITQYFVWLNGVIHGDMGVSYVSGKDVQETISAKLPATILLAVTASGITILVSIPLGILCAVKKGKWIDWLIRGVNVIGISMPDFFVALLLLYVFGVIIPVFPVISKGLSFKGVILPAVTLAIAMSAKYIRQVRSAVLQELSKPYVLGEKARGISFSSTLLKSVLKAGSAPLLTLFSLSIGSLLGGTAVVESIFMWDGVGKMAVDAIKMRDYPVIQGYVMWMAVIYAMVNLGADILCYVVDPRIHFQEKQR